MYARMVTSFVRPNRLNALTALYQNTLLPLIKRQPGFKGIYVMNDSEINKEVFITLWERLVDMEAFNVHLLALKDEIAPLLTSIPEIEIFQVVALDEVLLTDAIALSETALGLRIEDPFDRESGWQPKA